MVASDPAGKETETCRLNVWCSVGTAGYHTDMGSHIRHSQSLSRNHSPTLICIWEVLYCVRRIGCPLMEEDEEKLASSLAFFHISWIDALCWFRSSDGGLQRTSASSAGFITGISVVLVALLDMLVNRHVPSPLRLLGFLSAVLGLTVLSFGQSHVASLGNILILGCAVAFGFHVFYTDRYSKRFDVAVLTTEQIGVVVLISLVGAFVNSEFSFVPSSYAIFGLLCAGLLATALAYFLQTWGQKRTDATHSAIVLAAEPVFAAVFAVALLTEPVTIQLIVGGALVIFGMVLSSLRR